MPLKGPRSWFIRYCVLPELVGPTIRALKGSFLGSIPLYTRVFACGRCCSALWGVCLVLNRLQLPVHDVHLRVRDGEDVAVCVSRAGGDPFDLELHTVLCIDQPLAVAVHGGVGHGAQVDPEAELVGGEILGQCHVGPAATVWVEVTGQFIPHVSATDALVVHPVGHAVDRNLHFGDVGVEVAFRVPGTGCVGIDEQKQDAFERLALGVYPKIQAGVRASCDGHHPLAHDKVVGELLAAGICAHRLVGQGLAANDLVLQLDVFQLVPELAGVRAVYHLASWG